MSPLAFSRSSTVRRHKHRMEQDEINKKICAHQSANRNYIDQGISVLELAQNAAGRYSMEEVAKKREILKSVHSNSTWKDGQLVSDYRKPFDQLALTSHAYRKKKVAFPEKSDLCTFWLPSADGSGHWEERLSL